VFTSLRRVWEQMLRRRIVNVLWIGLLCFALALIAQRSLDQKARRPQQYLTFALAAVLFALAFGAAALEQDPDTVREHGVPGKSRMASVGVPVAISLGVALLGCLNFGGNRFRPWGLLCWIGGLAFCLTYLYIHDGPRRFGELVTDLFAGKSITLSRTWLLLGAAILLGAVLRLQHLEVIPADIGWDLPYNFADVLAILRKEYRIFFPANMGREGMFFYLAALVARFAPLSHFSLKLTSALIGIVTIPALYLATRRLFPESVAITAAFLLATNRWHIVLSRAGFRVILLPLFALFVLYALLRALHGFRPFDFALLGLSLGLGMHTYFPFLFAPAAVVVALAALFVAGRREHWRTLIPLLLLAVLVAWVVYAPLGRYAVENWKEYVARASLQARLLKGDETRAGINLRLLSDNMRTTLLMFNVYGDGNSRFNVPATRHFGFISAVLMVLGLFYALRRWRHGDNVVLLVFWFVFLLPSGLMALPRELPNIFRASGAIGPALILAALPVAAVAERLRDAARALPAWDWRIKLRLSAADDAAGGYQFVLSLGRRALLAMLPVLAVTLLVALEYQDTRRYYFQEFASVLPDRQNVSVAKEMVRQIETYGDRGASFIKVWPYWFDGRALLMYLREESEKSWNPYLFVDKLSADQPPLTLIKDHALFLLNPADVEGLNVLRGVFPHWASKPVLFPDGTPAYIALYVQR